MPSLSGGFYYLFLCPDLYPGEAALEPEPPLVGAVVHPAQVRHDRVEGPHVHKVEQLREQLDRQGRVHTTLPADQYKSKVEKTMRNYTSKRCCEYGSGGSVLKSPPGSGIRNCYYGSGSSSGPESYIY
jgi:hypothetical protein